MANSFFLHNCLSQSIKGRFRQRRTMGRGCCLSPAPSSLSERYFCLDVNKVAFWNMLLNQEGRRWAEPAWFLDRQPDTLCLGAAPVSRSPAERSFQRLPGSLVLQGPGASGGVVPNLPVSELHCVKQTQNKAPSTFYNLFASLPCGPILLLKLVRDHYQCRFSFRLELQG